MKSYVIDHSLVKSHSHKSLKMCLFHKIFKQVVMRSYYRLSILFTAWINCIGQYIHYYVIYNADLLHFNLF